MDTSYINTNGKRLFIARHGETVFNAVRRMQGMDTHTPLTRIGADQATLMGKALAAHVGPDSDLALLSSPAGRTLQTLALISEEIGHDWHKHSLESRLREIDIGTWEGMYYHDVQAKFGDFVDYEMGLFTQFAPEGESYTDVASRLKQWLDELKFERDMLVISHGLTARVLRGILTGVDPISRFDAPIAPSLAQGSMVMICDGVEELIINGDGEGERA